MKRLLLAPIVLLAACASAPSDEPSENLSQSAPPLAFAIHGGAGTISRDQMTSEKEAEFRAALEGSLRTGWAVLESGGSSLDAVVAALEPLEDSPLFNAGHGAVFTADGHVELDASIMDGATGRAGAVAGVRTVRHPIRAARLVMDGSEHVMLSGSGADEFALNGGLEIVPNDHFHTDHRREQLEKRQAEDKHGTVGAVALDKRGQLAAGTSTGGMTNKRWGRVGDSPIIGAGTWADENCAVSATGWGEFFIRGAVAHDIAANMEYAGLSLEEAGRRVINEKLTAAGGTGGVISIDSEGNVTAPFNTSGMYRGWIGPDGEPVVKIYAGE